MTLNSKNWKKAKIGDIATILTGGTPKTNIKEYWGGDINWMSSGEVNKRRIKYVDKKITNEGLNRSNATILPIDTIMVALAGQGKTRGKVAILEIETSCNQSLAGIVPNKELVNPEYLYQYLNSKYDQIRSLSGGDGRSGLNLTLIKNFEILIPNSIDEQKIIAQILSDFDDTIEKTDQIIQKSTIFKKAVLFGLLNEDSSNLVKLNSVTTKITDGTHKTPKYITSGIPFLRINDLRNQNIDWKNCKYISLDEHNDLIKRCKPEKGDVLLSKNGTIGITKVIDWDREFSIFVSLCLLKPDVKKILPEYLGVVLASEYVLNQAHKRSKQGTVTNLHLEEIRDFDIPLPDIDRQKEIVKILVLLDSKLEVERKTQDYLRESMRGITQNIFG